MMSVLEQAGRTTCVVCDLQSSATLCATCKSETREDFYLLLLTKFKDEFDNYFGLKAKCLDMHDAVEYYNVPDTPLLLFDQRVHTVDEHAKQLLEDHTGIPTDNIVPVKVEGDGDCLFHTIGIYYPIMTIDEIRSRCIEELCNHEQYYSTIKTEMGLDLVDDESVQDHVLRILNNQQYTGVLTLAALSTVFGQAIESIYPSVNDNDAYCDLLNTVFIPRNIEASSLGAPIRILWSGPEKQPDRDWRPNHFTPVLSITQSTITIESTFTDESATSNTMNSQSTAKPQQAVLYSSKSNITSINQLHGEIENEADATNVISMVENRRIFLEAPAIIQEILNAIKENRVFDHPPKIIRQSAIFVIKETAENRKSIGKDGNGVWTNPHSAEMLFMLRESKYQIIRRDSSGSFYYNERVGNRYLPRPVESNQIITMRRWVDISVENSY